MDQAGIVDNVSMLDMLQGQELKETLTHIIARLHLSVSKAHCDEDPGELSSVLAFKAICSLQTLLACDPLQALVHKFGQQGDMFAVLGIDHSIRALGMHDGFASI